MIYQYVFVCVWKFGQKLRIIRILKWEKMKWPETPVNDPVRAADSAVLDCLQVTRELISITSI